MRGVKGALSTVVRLEGVEPLAESVADGTSGIDFGDDGVFCLHAETIFTMPPMITTPKNALTAPKLLDAGVSSAAGLSSADSSFFVLSNELIVLSAFVLGHRICAEEERYK